MPSPRARRTRADESDARVRTWADALRSGAPVDQLQADITGTADAASAVPGLGAAVGVDALPLLSRLLDSPEATLAEAAAEALGHVKSNEAAAVLDQAARSAADRRVQKTARRSLHRLGSQGIRPPAQAPAAPATVGSRAATVYRVIASAYDGTGTRAMWFAAERPLGGIYHVAVTLNDVAGLTDLGARDTTRKRFAEQEAQIRERDPMAWVEIPPDYARQLVQEGVDLARAAGAGVPTYSVWADLVGNPAEPLAEALVYREINAFEARMHPTLQGETHRLFAEPEIEPWFFPPERVAKWARQLAEPASSRLIVTLESDAGRRERLLRDAVADLLPPRALPGMRRRLEETAYIFLRTDREAEARRAVAAAVTIEEERPLRPPHPFLRAMVERSIDIALRVERSEFEPVRLGRR